MAGIQAGIEEASRRRLLRKFDRLGNDVLKVLAAAVLDGAEIIRNAANMRAPGPNVKAEIEKLEHALAVVGIGLDKEHWYYVFFEFGAQPHEIGLENKQALRFGADPVFAKSGDHPGLAAQPFLGPAADQNREAVVRAIWNQFWDTITTIARAQ